MYLRHTTRRKDGKTHVYWQLVRSVRRGRKVVQQTYVQLTEAEAAFRIHKSDLAIRPIWHHKADRIKALQGKSQRY